PPAAPTRTAPTALSVTSLVSYARCPKQFYWSVVRPLPRQSSAAARLGTEVHRWIEQRAGRQLALLEPEVDDELDPDAVPAGVDPGALRTSYCYLRADGPAEIDAVDWDAGLLGEVRGRLGRALDSLTLGRYPTTAGPWCHRCDFLAFCPSGRAALDQDR